MREQGTIHWIDTEGGERCEPSDTPPSREQLRTFVKGNIETCWVLYKGRRTAMIVNEDGAIATDERGPLPVNLAASKIYAAASAMRGEDYVPRTPRIHGNAVVLENIPVE